MSAAGAEDQMHDREKADHPQRKRAQTDGARPTLHDMFVEILEEHRPERPRTTASQQVDGFFAETPIPRSEAALGYWRNDHLHFPALAKMARKYLSALCTRMDSEWLFSSASNILDEKRNRLSCNKAEMLILAKKNMHLTKKEAMRYQRCLKKSIMNVQKRRPAACFVKRSMFCSSLL